ncbi:MFS transporter [Dactylosporangium sp. CA-092794]|uniref:MFS transporter n=1 Tax=Dactylosporangium sp. CA-092794 TaxID=3239929 RepID=UPI003D8CDDDA
MDATMRSVLRHNRLLRRLLAALAVSQIGDWLYNLALVAFVYDRTGSVLWASATTAARVLPMVLLSPFGGVLADRYDRRRLMIWSDIARAGLMLLLAAVVGLGLPVLLAPVLAALSTAAAAVYPASVAATLPRLVRGAELAAANSARSVIDSASVIAGPAAGAVLLVLGSPATAFLGNALTFAASAVIVAALPAGALFAPPEKTTKAATVLHELREGATALRRQPFVLRLVGADTVGSLVYGALSVLLLLIAQRLGAGDGGYGYLLAGYGVGGLAGAAIAPRLVADRPRYAVCAALLAVAAPCALLAVVPWTLAAVLLSVVAGAGGIVVTIAADTLLAQALDPEVLGRAYGLAFPVSIGGIVVGSLLAGPLVAAVGLTGALLILAVLVVAYAKFMHWRPRADHQTLARTPSSSMATLS